MSSLYYYVSAQAIRQLKQIESGYYARYHREYRRHHIRVSDPKLVTWYCCKCKRRFQDGNMTRRHQKVLH